MAIRIGILSPFYQSYNYGEKLQAYALTEYLRRQGVEAEQICYAQPGQTALFDEGRKPRRVWNSAVMRRRMGQRLLGWCMPWLRGRVAQRCRALDSFDAQVPHTAQCYDDGGLFFLNGVYDGYLVGSGQVWNPALWKRGYFFAFLYGGNYCFSYAASLANALSPSWESYFSTCLTRLNGASVRERTAQHLVSRAIQRPVALSVDPVLLLQRSDWALLAEDVQVQEPYLFCFFEGPDWARRRAARRYARRRSLRIVTLTHLQAAEGRYFAGDICFGDQRLYDVTPGQLIMLVERAECVMTDSYHVTALSILFKKPFLVFEREGNEHLLTRLQDLLQLFHMEDRYCVGMRCIDVVYRMEEPLGGYREPAEDFEIRREASAAYLAAQLKAIQAKAKAQ
jgi:hypothetical protein